MDTVLDRLSMRRPVQHRVVDPPIVDPCEAKDRAELLLVRAGVDVALLFGNHLRLQEAWILHGPLVRVEDVAGHDASGDDERRVLAIHAAAVGGVAELGDQEIVDESTRTLQVAERGIEGFCGR